MFGRKVAPKIEVPELESDDRTYGVGTFVIFWLGFIWVREFDVPDKDLNAFRQWLLVYSASAYFAGRLTGVLPVAVATSVASTTFRTDAGEIADSVVRMSDNWKRLGIDHPGAVDAYCTALEGMTRHPLAPFLVQLNSSAQSREEHEAVYRVAPTDLTQPAIHAFNRLIAEANAASFRWN